MRQPTTLTDSLPRLTVEDIVRDIEASIPDTYLHHRLDRGMTPTAVIMEGILDGFTYKRDWTFHLELQGDVWAVRIAWRSWDSRNPDRKTDVALNWTLPTIRQSVPLENQRLYLIRGLRRKIHECETHEADEFMLFDGVRLFDPHLLWNEPPERP